MPLVGGSDRLAKVEKKIRKANFHSRFLPQHPCECASSAIFNPLSLYLYVHFRYQKKKRNRLYFIHRRCCLSPIYNNCTLFINCLILYKHSMSGKWIQQVQDMENTLRINWIKTETLLYNGIYNLDKKWHNVIKSPENYEEDKLII